MQDVPISKPNYGAGPELQGKYGQNRTVCEGKENTYTFENGKSASASVGRHS